MSERETAACLGDVFGAGVAVGPVRALEQTLSAALAPVMAEAPTALQRAAVVNLAVVNLEETGWRRARRRGWLWAAVTATRTVFQIHASRGGAVARALLGATWSGIVGSDRGTL